jgi:hypothetical protein
VPRLIYINPSMTRLTYLPLALLLTLFLTACGPTDPNEKFIQGTWMAAGDLGEGHSWYLEWTFENGKFSVEGYPPLTQTGDYKVTKSEGTTLTLELTNQEGDWPTDDTEIIVIIDPDNQTLTIDNQGPFTKTTP